jgi:exodeoxyribonuclease VII large subunit
MNEPARVNMREWSVSELSAALRKTVEDAFGYVRVRGEISGFRGAHSSGHCYFALKDETAKIEAVIWKSAFARMRIKPEEGLEVVVTGRLTTYPGQSKYQIVVETLAPAGVGALMALVEARKQKLAAEGVFDPAHKQALPFLPEMIGVITSSAGAVIRDILHRLADRFPRHVIVWPVRVQGEGSAEEIAAAIEGFNALQQRGIVRRPDLIIVARGGGSIEDLWSFNEEIVVRAAAASLIPLISAVGHETDITLIDFAADMRAPTPTAAAEMAVPVRSELILRLDGLMRRSLACWQRCQEARRTELRAAMRAFPAPDQLLAFPRQRLDHASARLPRALIANAQCHHTQYSALAGRLGAHVLQARMVRCCELLVSLAERTRRAESVARLRREERLATATARLRAGVRANAESYRNRILRAQERVAALGERVERAAWLMLSNRSTALERCGQLLNVLSHRGVLARGFALVRNLRGTPVRQAAAVSRGMAMDIEFFDGRVRASAEAMSLTTAEKPLRITRNRGRRGGDPGQGSLFG